MSDRFTLTCDKIPDLRFVGFRGKEQISRPYEFEIFFTVPTGTAVRDAIGQRATVRAARAGDLEPVVFHGLLAQVSLVHQATNRRTERDRSLYRALLVPRLWFLQQFWRSFVFTGKSVKEFLTDTLQAGGLVSDEFRFDIGSHPTEEFVTQYRESHLDFFHRWCEREGLYYYFEHKPDAANEVLVVVEDKAHAEVFPGGAPIPYHPVMHDDVSAVEALHEIELHTDWLSQTVVLADYDFSNPSASVGGDSPVTAQGVGIVRDYGYRTFVADDAQRLATIRAESIGCRETTLRGRGTFLGPRPGYKLAISDRPDDVEEEWLAVEVEHAGTMSATTAEVARLTGLSTKQTYTMSIFAVPAAVQYRAPQTTEWPRIYSLENGIVMGEATSPYAQIDAAGNYLVRFQFDSSELPDGKVSTRLRMMQPHGGASEGHHFPLRKGTEVMVGFLGGDPDRPFIAGVVPNAHKPSVVVQRNYTQNIIHTGSDNEIVLEDLQGKEFIYMHTPNQNAGIYLGVPTPRAFVDPDSAKPGLESTIDGAQVSLYMNTDANAGLQVGGSMWTDIGGNESIYVGENVSHGYAGTYKLQVGGATTEHYYADENITVDGAREETVTGSVTETYGPQTTEVKGGGKLDVSAGFFHKVGALNTDDYGEWGSTIAHGWDLSAKDVLWTVGGAMTVDAGGHDIKVKAPVVLVIADVLKIDAPGDHHKEATTTFDFYGNKNAVGSSKSDTVKAAIGLTGAKADVVGFAAARSILKVEKTNTSVGAVVIKTDMTAFKGEDWVMKDGKPVAKADSGGAKNESAGAAKI
ncbi:MAG: type VI secretion system tip protein TssI/VgrG [Polyangiaceae bacterium]